jgi:predicted PurR-regulated permease PerM
MARADDERSHHPQLSPSRHSLAVNVLLTCGIVGGLLLLTLLIWQGIQVLLLLFLGILLAILIRGAAAPLIDYLHFPDTVAVVTVLLLMGILLGAAGWALAPSITEQFEELQEVVPETIEELARQLEGTTLGQLLNETTDDGETLREQLPQMLWQATGMLYSFGIVVMAAVIVLFVALFAALSPAEYIGGLLRLAPPSYRPRLREVVAGVGFTLRWWLMGKLVEMTAVGIMTGVGLWLLDIPLAVLLAMLAFLLEFIPNFGPIMAAVPAVLLALAESPTTALYTALMYLVVQQVQSLVVTPIVQRQAVRLPPVLTILGQVLLGVLAGGLGLLPATPLTAVALVMTKMLYVEDILGDRISTPDKEVDRDEMPELPEPEE